MHFFKVIHSQTWHSVKPLLSLTTGLGGGDNEEGSITLSLANLFTCKFFTYPKSNDDKVHLLQISEQLEQVNKKIGNLEKQLELSRVIPFRSRKTSIGGRGSVKSQSEAGLAQVNENDDENGEFNSDSDANDSERLGKVLNNFCSYICGVTFKTAWFEKKSFRMNSLLFHMKQF